MHRLVRRHALQQRHALESREVLYGLSAVRLRWQFGVTQSTPPFRLHVKSPVLNQRPVAATRDAGAIKGDAGEDSGIEATEGSEHPGKSRRQAASGVPLEDPALLRRLLRAKDRMDAASHEQWPVRRLAEVSGVSEAHFARSFKQAFGIPPHRYLLTRRIEQAATLLRDTELGITEIVYATGWESLGTFGRIFRDIMGMSPTAIRLQARATSAALDRVPACVVKAAERPDLTTAVLEKRRRAANGK